jgi:hypothetical protein
MYLDAGFKEFARAHSLEVRCLVHCLYEGGGDMSMRVFNDPSCRMHYHRVMTTRGSCRLHGILSLQRR